MKLHKITNGFFPDCHVFAIASDSAAAIELARPRFVQAMADLGNRRTEKERDIFVTRLHCEELCPDVTRPWASEFGV